MRRIAVFLATLFAVAAITTEVQAAPASGLSGSAARAKAKPFVKKEALKNTNANNEHGTPSNWGVITASECEKVSFSTVRCAYGIFWADGHQCFNQAVVKGSGFQGNKPTKTVVTKRFKSDACDEEGTENGGSSTPGTATDIGPDGRSPAEPAEEEEGA